MPQLFLVVRKFGPEAFTPSNLRKRTKATTLKPERAPKCDLPFKSISCGSESTWWGARQGSLDLLKISTTQPQVDA